MPAGYSGKPLVQKLGIKDNMTIYVVNHPGEEYDHELGPLSPTIKQISALENGIDLIHFFTTSREELRDKLPLFKNNIKPAGIIWVSWPKKSSNVETDIDENIIRDAALSLGMVDVKVCAVTKIWSGLKLVIRRENR